MEKKNKNASKSVEYTIKNQTSDEIYGFTYPFSPLETYRLTRDPQHSSVDKNAFNAAVKRYGMPIDYTLEDKNIYENPNFKEARE